MPSRPKVLSHGPICRAEALSVPWGLEALHAPLALPRRLVRVFSAVVEVPMRPMFHTRQAFALGRPIARQLVGDDHPRGVRQPFEQLAEKCLRGVLVPSALHQDVEDVAVLSDRPPEVRPPTTNCEEHLVAVPLVTRPGGVSADRVHGFERFQALSRF